MTDVTDCLAFTSPPEPCPTIDLRPDAWGRLSLPAEPLPRGPVEILLPTEGDLHNVDAVAHLAAPLLKDATTMYVQHWTSFTQVAGRAIFAQVHEYRRRPWLRGTQLGAPR